MTTQDRIEGGGSSSVCRFCPSIDQECVSLYDSPDFINDSIPPLTEIVLKLTDISITPEDGGPQQICVDKCLPRLVDCYLLGQQILQAEEQRWWVVG